MTRLLLLCGALLAVAGCPAWLAGKFVEHPHCAAKVCPDPETACYCNMCGGWCPQ